MNDATILEARQLAILDQPRGESAKAWHLPDEHFCNAVQAELAGVPYRRIQELLVADGLPEGKVPSRSRWSEFWSCFKPFLRIARRRAAASGANEVAEEAQKSPAEFDRATLDMIRQLAFELADVDAPDVGGVKTLVGLLLKHGDQEIKREQVEVSKRKLAILEQQQSRAKETLSDAALSPEQRQQKMREIFGLA